MPTAEYSETADALYVALSDAAVACTQSLDDHRMIDLGADGAVVGLEFLSASAGISLRDIPNADLVRTVITSAKLPIRVAS